MKIGIDIRSLITYPRTGVGEYTYRLLQNIFTLDKDNEYFLFYNSHKNNKNFLPNWNFPNVKIIKYNFPNKIFNNLMSFFNFPKIDRLINNIDIFFAPNLSHIALSKKTKFILTIHDISFLLFPEFYNLKQKLWHKIIKIKKQCELADIILVPSENTKRDLINYYQIKTEKIQVNYLGIPLDVEKQNTINSQTIKTKYDLPEKYILFLGTIEPRKNILGLIEAYELLNEEKNIEHFLVIVGASGWKNKKIYKKINNSKYKNKIKVINCINSEEKESFYKMADLFIYPSFYEGFGFPVLEALSAGVPVITSNRSSLLEISKNATYLIDPTKPKQIALAMKDLIYNQNLRKKQIEQGLKIISDFSWEKSAKNWIETINNLI